MPNQFSIHLSQLRQEPHDDLTLMLRGYTHSVSATVAMNDGHDFSHTWQTTNVGRLLNDLASKLTFRLDEEFRFDRDPGDSVSPGLVMVSLERSQARVAYALVSSTDYAAAVQQARSDLRAFVETLSAQQRLVTCT